MPKLLISGISQIESSMILRKSSSFGDHESNIDKFKKNKISFMACGHVQAWPTEFWSFYKLRFFNDWYRSWKKVYKNCPHSQILYREFFHFDLL